MDQIQGRAVSLMVNPGSRLPMQHVGSLTFVEEYGIQDNKSYGLGRQRRQVLLIEEETLESFGLEHGIVKENVTTAGIDLTALKEGETIAFGDEVLLAITDPCDPCSRMEEIRPGLQQELQGRRGILATIVRGGVAKVGDALSVVTERETAQTT